MPPRKKSTGSRASSVNDETARPDVIVDFRFERGLLYIALINLSDAPAYRVSTRFAKPFRGLGGDCVVSTLPMFRRVEFLAPHKRIETLEIFHTHSAPAFVAQEQRREAANAAPREHAAVA